MTNDMCLLDIRVSYFLKHLFKSFAHFYWVVSLSVIVKRLHIFYIQAHCQLCVLQILPANL